MREAQHERVIPRDFFNEAKLLKCMGMLSLKILDRQLPDGVEIEIEERGEPFEIRLTDDGLLHVNNYPVTVNGRTILFGTTYNSKEATPFYCVADYVEYEVFDIAGDFSTEFIEFATSLVEVN